MSDVTSPGAVTGRCHKCGEFTYAQATHECSAALELVRLREGIGRLASEWERGANALEGTPMAWDLRRYARAVRALLDDNEGER